MKLAKLLGLAIALLFTGSAFADAIYLTPDGCPNGETCWTLTNPSPGPTANPDADDIEALVGATDLASLYKAEVGDEEDDPDTPQDDTLTTEEGAFANDYSTEFFDSPLDPSGATISWDGPNAINCSVDDPCYLKVKDGTADPNVYIFDISSWDGTSDINLTGFWPGRGAISHVEIFGGSSQVPEPGTLALLGIGLFGIGLLHRRRTS